MRKPNNEQLIELLIGLIPQWLVVRICDSLAPRLKPSVRNDLPRLIVNKLSKYYINNRVPFEVCSVPEMGKLVLPTSDNHYAKRKFGVMHPARLLNQIEDIVQEGETVCELGPHLGEMMLFLRNLVGHSGKVYAFEMDQTYYKFLNWTINENLFKNCIVENKAIYNLNKTIDVGDGYCDYAKWIDNFPELSIALYLGTSYFTNTPQSWNESETKDLSSIFDTELRKSTKIQTIELFDYFKNLDPVDLFFMDIEGAEIFAIPSIIKLGNHWGTKPKIVFEYHLTYSGEQLRYMRETLLDNKYKLYSPDKRHVFAM